MSFMITAFQWLGIKGLLILGISIIGGYFYYSYTETKAKNLQLTNDLAAAESANRKLERQKQISDDLNKNSLESIENTISELKRSNDVLQTNIRGLKNEKDKCPMPDNLRYTFDRLRGDYQDAVRRDPRLSSPTIDLPGAPTSLSSTSGNGTQ